MENKYEVILLGNDAQEVEEELGKYDASKKLISSNRRGPNTTEKLYQFGKSMIHLLYNEYNEVSGVGEDIPNQARCNLGLTIVGPDVKSVKLNLEKIIGIKLVSGHKTKEIAEKGIK